MSEMLNKFPKNLKAGNYLLIASVYDVDCDKCAAKSKKSKKGIAYYVHKDILEKNKFIENEHKILRMIKCESGDNCYDEVANAIRIQFQRFIDRENIIIENQHLFDLLK